MSARNRRSLSLFLLAILTALPFARGQDPIVDADFTDATSFHPLQHRAPASGALPAGWDDDSAWNSAPCVYSHETDATGGFLRASCMAEKFCQFFCNLPNIAVRQAYAITFRARSPQSISLGVRIQENGNPLALTGADFRLTPEWTEYAVKLAAGPADGKKVGLRLFYRGPAAVELSSLRVRQIPLTDYTPRTTIPTPKPEQNGWMQRHNWLAEELVRAKPELLIMGDSITAAWQAQGKAAWEQYLAPLKAGQFGIAGDRVENLLWRVENSALGKEVQPKVVVILIGINNVGGTEVQEIDEGMQKLVSVIRARCPNAKLLLLGVFPVGQKADDARRAQVKALNALYAKQADNRQVFFLDIGDLFLEKDGTISPETLFDFVHCTPRSYELYARKLQEQVKKMLASQ